MNDRDRFAAVALTGLLLDGDETRCSADRIAECAYKLADAMLDERDKSAAKRCADWLRNGSSGYTDGISPEAESKTAPVHPAASHTPANRGDGGRPPDVTRGRNTQGPVAWAADIPGKFGAAPTVLFGYTEKLVKSIAAAGGDLVQPFPLYRQPTITDAERLAVCYAASTLDNLPWHQQKLRELLERTR
jgi:hypothetical protein